MSKDMLEKLKRLGGAKVTTADTLGVKAAKPAAKPVTPKVADTSWADDVMDEDEEADEEEVGYSIEDEIEEDEDDSDIPESSHRDPVAMTGVPNPGSFDADAFAKKVADLLFAKMRDAFNSVP